MTSSWLAVRATITHISGRYVLCFGLFFFLANKIMVYFSHSYYKCLRCRFLTPSIHPWHSKATAKKWLLLCGALLISQRYVYDPAWFIHGDHVEHNLRCSVTRSLPVLMTTQSGSGGFTEKRMESSHLLVRLTWWAGRAQHLLQVSSASTIK